MQMSKAGALLIAGSALCLSSMIESGRGGVQVSRCNGSVVRFDRNPISGYGLSDYPWISPTGKERKVVGYLFYYPTGLLRDRRYNQSETLVIPVGGQGAGGVSAKILWVLQGTTERVLEIRGRRLDGPGRNDGTIRWSAGDERARALEITGQRIDGRGWFRQRLSRTDKGFSGPLAIPTAGCWLLLLRSGTSGGSVVVQALA